VVLSRLKGYKEGHWGNSSLFYFKREVVNDVNSFLKAISLCLSSYLICSDLQNRPKKFKNYASVILMVIYFYYINVFLTFIEPVKSLVIIATISLVDSKIKKKKFYDIFVYKLVSFSIAYILYMICAFISPIVLISVFHISKKSLLQPVISNLLLIFITVLISKKLYLPPHENKNHIVSIFLSGVIFILYSLLANKTMLSDSAIMVAIMGECLCLLILLLWLRNLRAASFNRSVYKSSLKKEIEKYYELQSSHEELEHKVHSDRKFLLSLYQAVEMLANESTDEKTKIKAMKLFSELKEIRADKSYQSKDDIGIPIINISIINALFRSMSEIARRNSIHIQYEVDKDILKILEHISISQLERIIADLMENAIIAVKTVNNQNKTISVVFGLKKEGYYQFSIYDNGVPFSKATLDVLGKQRTTTHSNSGGGGIGYMSIFEILQSTKASLIIDQRQSEKTIIVRFDGKTEFIVF